MPNSDFKRRSLRLFFEDSSFNKKINNNNKKKMSNDMKSVPELKMVQRGISVFSSLSN